LFKKYEKNTDKIYGSHRNWITDTTEYISGQ